MSTPPLAPVRRYVWTALGLLLLLALTAGAARLRLGAVNTPVAVGVSILKTLLVMAVFMHEAGARRLTQIASALGFIWLLILIGLMLADFLTRAVVPPPW